MKQIRGEPLQGKKVVVVGGGSSGVAAARLSSSAGARVLLLERDPSAIDRQTALLLGREAVELETGRHGEEQFRGADLVCLSPGIPDRVIRELLPARKEPPIVSELELAWWFADKPVIAVTGTNGKTTTVSLVKLMLESSGTAAFLGGNIAPPLSEYILEGEPKQVLVLEASSFQLQNTVHFRPEVGVLLNFSPNHLDHHLSLEEYFRAKLRLFRNQRETDLALLPQRMRGELETQPEIPPNRQYFRDRGVFSCPALLGDHNRENMEAAYAACRPFGVSQEAAQEALKNFSPAEHRLQPLGRINGVLFVDDSKGTTLTAQRAALQSFDSPVLLLAGGRLKGGDPREIADLVQSRVKAAGVFGECRQDLRDAWKDITRVESEPDMERALQRLLELARPGDVILLAPGTSSFDQYADFRERGRAFQELVRALGPEDSESAPE